MSDACLAYLHVGMLTWFMDVNRLVAFTECTDTAGCARPYWYECNGVAARQRCSVGGGAGRHHLVDGNIYDGLLGRWGRWDRCSQCRP